MYLLPTKLSGETSDVEMGHQDKREQGFKVDKTCPLEKKNIMLVLNAKYVDPKEVRFC